MRVEVHRPHYEHRRPNFVHINEPVGYRISPDPDHRHRVLPNPQRGVSPPKVLILRENSDSPDSSRDDVDDSRVSGNEDVTRDQPNQPEETNDSDMISADEDIVRVDPRTPSPISSNADSFSQQDRTDGTEDKDESFESPSGGSVIIKVEPKTPPPYSADEGDERQDVPQENTHEERHRTGKLIICTLY